MLSIFRDNLIITTQTLNPIPVSKGLAFSTLSNKKGFLVLNLEATLRTPQDTRPSEQIAKNHTQKVAPQLHGYFLE